MNQQTPKPQNWRQIILAFAQKHGKTDIVSNVAVAALLHHPHGAALIVEFLKSLNVIAAPVDIQNDAQLYITQGNAKYLYTGGKNYKFADNVELALRDVKTEDPMSLIKLLRRFITKSNFMTSIWRYININPEHFSVFLDQKIATQMVEQASPAPAIAPVPTPTPTSIPVSTTPSRPDSTSAEKKTMHPDDILTALSDAAPGQHHIASAIGELLSLQLADLLPGPAIAPSIMLLGAPDSGQMEMVRALERIYCPEKPAAAGTDAKPATAPESNVLTIDGNNYSLDHHVAGLGGAPSEYKGSEKGGLLTNFLRKTGPKIVYIVNINCAHRNVIDLINGIVRGETARDHNGAAFNARDAFFVFSATSIYNEASSQPTLRERDQCLFRLARKETGDALVDAMHNVLVLKPIQGGAAYALIKAEMGRITESLGKRQITLVVGDPVLQYLAKGFGATRPNKEEEITSAQITEFLTPLVTLPIASLIQTGEIKAGQTITPGFARDGFVIDTPTAATPAIESAVRQANAASPRRQQGKTPPPPQRPPQREMGA